MDNEAIIAIFERGKEGKVLIPWTPKKIKFKSGKTSWAKYNIMDLGTIQKSVGVGLRSVGWDDGVFPGEAQKDMAWQVGNWIEPSHCVSLL